MLNFCDGSQSEHLVDLAIQLGMRLHSNKESKSSLRVTNVAQSRLSRQIEDVIQLSRNVNLADLIKAMMYKYKPFF